MPKPTEVKPGQRWRCTKFPGRIVEVVSVHTETKDQHAYVRNVATGRTVSASLKWFNEPSPSRGFKLIS